MFGWINWLRPLWTRYAQIEERLSKLENKVTEELEPRSQRHCLGCGKRQYFVVKSEAKKNENGYTMGYRRTYQCSDCGFTEPYDESSQYPSK